ncbi:ATP synthase [Aerococcus urinaehominis]|uniref:ATP synthase n=1 Tax=Aerococcus urinaehominis TaxID=128944 RepID=A0A109RGH2_9LACT|nr:V-type ATP synthase subunit F [Aerococcus urinaehominis]AMB98874.1 ATP synthase [Aerococcus urinaehominis]SDM16381.1 V/A-type H+-transporting ATPase subunit F [Aerococcus urinaehominis]
MKQFVIVDNAESLTGMRLAGIEGVLIDDKHDFDQVLDQVLEKTEIGLIHISPSLIASHQERINDIRFNRTSPLLVSLKGPNDHQADDSITDTIQQAIGIQL